MNHRSIKILISLTIIAVVVGGGLYWTWPHEPAEPGRSRVLPAGPTLAISPPAAEAAPTITWNPTSVTDSVATGQTKTLRVSFTSSQPASNVSVDIVPALLPFVRVSPTTLPSVAQGQTIHVTLTLSASKNSPVGTVQGVIQVRVGPVLAKPLPVNITICRCVTAKGVSLDYPSNWQLNSQLLDLNGPIALNTFSNAYGEGGIIPNGGAEIDITTIPLPTQPLSGFIAKELVDAVIESTTAVTVIGETATQVTYIDTYTPGLSYKNVAIYFPHGTLLYKLYLSYRAGDPAEPQFLAEFQQVVNSLQLTQ